MFRRSQLVLKHPVIPERELPGEPFTDQEVVYEDIANVDVAQ